MASEIVNSVLEAEKSAALAVEAAMKKADEMKKEAVGKAYEIEHSFKAEAKQKSEEIIKSAQVQADKIRSEAVAAANAEAEKIKAAAKEKSSEAVAAAVKEILGQA